MLKSRINRKAEASAICNNGSSGHGIIRVFGVGVSSVRERCCNNKIVFKILVKIARGKLNYGPVSCNSYGKSSAIASVTYLHVVSLCKLFGAIVI